MKLTEAIRERRLTSFFVLAYALAWGLEAVPGLVGMKQPSWPSWFVTGFLGALAVVGLVGRDLYQNRVRGRTARVGRPAGGD